MTIQSSEHIYNIIRNAFVFDVKNWLGDSYALPSLYRQGNFARDLVKLLLSDNEIKRNGDLRECAALPQIPPTIFEELLFGGRLIVDS